MALPAASYFALGLSATNGSTALNDWLAATRQFLSTQDESELTISSGSVTATIAQHTLDTESDAASDDLTNIVISSFVGFLLLVRCENSARVVTLKHEQGGAGQLSLKYGQDAVLDDTSKYVVFWLDTGASPTTLREVARFGFAAVGELEVNTAGVGSPNILTTLESGKLFSNEGSGAQNYHALPSARAGLGPYTFIVQDTDGIRIVANSGDTIRVAASACPAAGYIEATTVGNVVTLHAINATEWIATSYVGTWTVSV